MKILFLCPSLEPGRDGVGDYTSRLAPQLEKYGHECQCVSIHDAYVPVGSEQESHQRLSSNAPWRRRIEVLQRTVDAFRPEWVSLQYVPHGFSTKGIPVNLVYHLPGLRGGFTRHIMCHELWDARTKPLKKAVLHRLQKLLLKSLMQRLRVSAVSTSTQLYQARLRQIDVGSSILPLFSNIEVADCPVGLREQFLQTLGIQGAENAWVFVIFGTIRAEWEHDGLVELLEEYRTQSGRKNVVVLSIGGIGSYGANLWQEMSRHSPPSVIFHRMGNMSSEDISRHLQIADFGIAISPIHHLGKSGSFAAMRSHGLTVIASGRNTIDPTSVDNAIGIQGVIPLGPNSLSKLRSAGKCEIRDSCDDVAKMFLDVLSSDGSSKIGGGSPRL